MRKDAIDILLGKEIKGCTLRVNAAKHFVFNFDETFLSGSVRITIKDKSAAVAESIKLKP